MESTEIKPVKMIREALAECMEYRDSHDQEMEADDYNNNEGWIEALEFVLQPLTFNLAGMADKALKEFESEMYYQSGYASQNGGFVTVEVIDVLWRDDVLTYIIQMIMGNQFEGQQYVSIHYLTPKGEGWVVIDDLDDE